MAEIYLMSIFIIGGVLLALFLLHIVVLDKKWDQIASFYKISAIPGLILVIAAMSFYKTKKKTEFSVVRHLELVEKLTPQYIYGYNKYAVNFQGNEIVIDKIQGYSTDSAAVVDKVSVYRQVRKPIWGFVEGNYGGDEYILSLKITPNIQRGLKQAEQVELKDQ